MNGIWPIIPTLVAAAAVYCACVLAVMVFATLLGGSITATPQATAVTLLALWGVGVGVGWLAWEWGE